jgi:hypothetical protein
VVVAIIIIVVALVGYVIAALITSGASPALQVLLNDCFVLR